MKLSIVNRWNGNVIIEGDFDNIKSLINAFPGADLRRADLSGADLDFSCWPLWCGSLKVIIDDKLKAQLLYHCISVIGIDKFEQSQIDFANTFHRIGECPKLVKS